MAVPESSKIKHIVAALLPWFAAHARDLPWRRTRDPYAIWVSEVMLQQTQVKTVIPYWERWMQALPTLQAAAGASSDQIHKLWEGLGYYTRVRNLQKAAQVILDRHNGRFPEAFDDVLALPGIGRYTAGAICSIAFNQPVPILDGNVIRVLTRLFAIEENPKDKATNARLWHLAEALVKQAAASPPRAQSPEPEASFLNQSLMELGALICTPRQPRCLLCPVQSCCKAARQQCPEAFPNLSERLPATARHFMAFVVASRGEVFVRRRPAGVVNAHLWEFPNMEVLLRSQVPEDLFHNLFYAAPKTLQPLCVVKHSITRYRITLTAHLATLTRRPPKLPGKWVKPDRLSKLAFTAAHKKLAIAFCRRMPPAMPAKAVAQQESRAQPRPPGKPSAVKLQTAGTPATFSAGPASKPADGG
jgi:A/G-specific adenine glycosylase